MKFSDDMPLKLESHIFYSNTASACTLLKKGKFRLKTCVSNRRGREMLFGRCNWKFTLLSSLKNGFFSEVIGISSEWVGFGVLLVFLNTSFPIVGNVVTVIHTCPWERIRKAMLWCQACKSKQWLSLRSKDVYGCVSTGSCFCTMGICTKLKSQTFSYFFNN